MRQSITKYITIFLYTPDANYTGVESFTIVAINYQDLNASLDINITASIPDRPEITTSRIIDVDEQTQLVQKLRQMMIPLVVCHGPG